MLVTSALVLVMNALKTHVQTSAPRSYTCSYQPLSNGTSLKIATHRYSPSKTGGSYHALVLTREYAIPTSYMYAIAFLAGLNGLQID